MKTINKIILSFTVGLFSTTNLFAACAANMDMGGYHIISTAEPTDDDHLANKKYVDEQVDSVQQEFDSFRVNSGFAVKDHEGNIYDTFTFGTQTWMTQNLRATTTPNNMNVNIQQETNEWNSSSISFVQDNSGNIMDLVEYGVSYTPHVAKDGDDTTYPVKGLCPEDWHIPTKSDITEFKNYFESLDSNTTAGYEIFNSNFNIKLSGYVNQSGTRSYFAPPTTGYGSGYFWHTVADDSTDMAFARVYVSSLSTLFYTDQGTNSTYNSVYAIHIRCIKD